MINFKCLNVFLLDPGVSVYWLGDFVFVESGLGVRVKFDLTNTVYLTVTAEHRSATRGLCGVYNGNADGEKRADTHLMIYRCKCSTISLTFPAPLKRSCIFASRQDLQRIKDNFPLFT